MGFGSAYVSNDIRGTRSKTMNPRLLPQLKSARLRVLRFGMSFVVIVFFKYRTHNLSDRSVTTPLLQKYTDQKVYRIWKYFVKKLGNSSRELCIIVSEILVFGFGVRTHRWVSRLYGFVLSANKRVS